MKKVFLIISFFAICLLGGCVEINDLHPNDLSRQKEVFLGDASINEIWNSCIQNITKDRLPKTYKQLKIADNIFTNLEFYKVEARDFRGIEGCSGSIGMWGPGYYLLFENEKPKGLVPIGEFTMHFGGKQGQYNDFYILRNYYYDEDNILYKNFVPLYSGFHDFFIGKNGSDIYGMKREYVYEDKMDENQQTGSYLVGYIGEIYKNGNLIFSKDFSFGSSMYLFDEDEEGNVIWGFVEPNETLYEMRSPLYNGDAESYTFHLMKGSTEVLYDLWEEERSQEDMDEKKDSLAIKYLGNDTFAIGKKDQDPYGHSFYHQSVIEESIKTSTYKSELLQQELFIRKWFSLLNQGKYREAYEQSQTQETFEQFQEKRSAQNLINVDNILYMEFYEKITGDLDVLDGEYLDTAGNYNIFAVKISTRSEKDELNTRTEYLQVVNGNQISFLYEIIQLEPEDYDEYIGTKEKTIDLYYKLIANHMFEEAYALQYAPSKSLENFSKTYQDIIGVEFIDHSPMFDESLEGEIAVIIDLIDNQGEKERYFVEKEYIDGKLKHLTSEKTEMSAINYCDGCGRKPLIYLYPEKESEINIHLPIKGKFTVTYPQISENNTREVTAQPDGTLENKADGREYSYLFREGEMQTPREIEEGFVVKKEDTIEFLQEKLAFLGLTPREYNEFIVYRRPLMMKNERNLISFIGEEYTNQAPLFISPKPDSMQRVFMVFKGLDEPIEVEEQILQPFERYGFSVIERGGSEIF